jgi:tRNA A37 threonylcarbamoyladenosine biosynthesis protein TsaE
VEWADKAMNVLSPEHLLIEINYVSDTVRNLTLNPSGHRYITMLSQLNQEPETINK